MAATWSSRTSFTRLSTTAATSSTRNNRRRAVPGLGAGARAARLGRSDIAGKTGTTNEFVDAWFAGYQPALVAISWVGFDQPKTLGKNQTGGVVALPIWVSYMEKILKDVPEMPREMPPGIVVLPTGPYPSAGGESRLVPEFFYRQALPPPELPPPAPPLPPPPPPVPRPHPFHPPNPPPSGGTPPD